jgi:hypothetical protein
VRALCLFQCPYLETQRGCPLAKRAPGSPVNQWQTKD